MNRRVLTGIVAGVCLFNPRAKAQFFGGKTDGFAHDGGTAFHQPVNGVFPSVQAARGASGDGFSLIGLFNFVPDGSNLSATAFAGGGNGADGFDHASIANFRPDGVNDPAFVFAGGASGGDGFDHTGVNNIPPDGQVASVVVFSASANGSDGFDQQTLFNFRPDGQGDPVLVFSASDNGGDGFAKLGVANVRPDGALDPGFVFSGSPAGGDGFNLASVANVRPDGFSDPIAVFSGSMAGADGFDRVGVLNQAISGSFSGSPFTCAASGGDGWSSALVANFYLTSLPDFVFTGGRGDGFNRGVFPPNTDIDPSVSYAAWRARYFSPAQIAAGLADPGADPDGDGLINALEYALDGNPLVPEDPDDFVSETPISNFLTISARKAAYFPHVSFAADLSPEIQPWSPTNAIITEDSASRFTARDSIAIGALDKNFLRLRVTLLP